MRPRLNEPRRLNRRGRQNSRECYFDVPLTVLKGLTVILNRFGLGKQEAKRARVSSNLIRHIFRPKGLVIRCEILEAQGYIGV